MKLRNLNKTNVIISALSLVCIILFLGVMNTEPSYKSEYNEAKNTLDKLQITYKDQANLLKGTEKQLEEAENELKETQAQLEETQVQLEDSQTQLEDTQAQFEDTQAQLKKTKSKLTSANKKISKLETNATSKNTTGTKQQTNNISTEKKVYIPRTGSKYHSSASCSNMKNPSYVSISTATSRGYTSCSKCY